MVRGMVDEGDDHMPGIGADIADPDVTESAYDGDAAGAAAVAGRTGWRRCSRRATARSPARCCC